MSYAKITDIWAELCEPLILEQYKESSNLKALIKVFVDACGSFETAADRLRSFYNIDTATGAILDTLGAIRNFERKTGESDDEYRARLVEDTKIDNAGTPNFVMQRAASVSGDPAPIYFEEAAKSPVAFIYTPNGDQLSRAFVDRLTPAGVLGVPAAKIKFCNGSTIRAVGEYTMGVIANDSGTDKHIEASDNGTSVIIGGVTNTGKRAFVGVAIDH